MSLKINTNIAALNAHRNMLKTDSGLSKSLERLSSGLRINKAADDASGMAIADSLKAQALGLGQAIANANDAVSVIQTADGALEESINIINTIRTKALQAASDGQSSDSRAAIQRDINKLLGSLNNIADTTAFNGQTLLKGNFQNKFFQVGAYANQTVSVSIANADASHVGRLATTTTTADSTSTDTRNIMVSDDLSTYAAADLADGVWAGFASTSSISINGTNIGGHLEGQGSDQMSALGLATAINNISDSIDVSATATTEWTGTGAVEGGTVVDGGILINGVNIGAVDVATNDATGTLTAAINSFSSQTGVSASVSAAGLMTLTAADGRNIALSGTAIDTSGGSVLGTGFVENTTQVTLDIAGSGGANDLEFNIDGVNITALAASLTGTAATDDGYVAGLIQDEIDAGTLSSSYSIDITADDGTIVLSRADGKDVNVVLASDNTASELTVNGTNPFTAAYDQESLVVNNSFMGTVSLTSDSSIAISGDATALPVFGFSSTGSSISASGGIIDADVTSFSAAQITVQRADSALTSLDTIRSQLGSAQNQVESTIRNITVTQVNVTSAESGIRDVDFAAESANFAKFQVLSQSGSFAMAQANATLQNVLRLLQ